MDGFSESFTTVSRTAEPTPAPPPELTPQTVWDKIAGLFRAKKMTARQTYLTLLRRVEGEGATLNAKETAELATAIEQARITPDEIASHRELFQRRAIERERAAPLLEVSQKLSDVESRYQKLTTEIDRLATERAKVLEQFQDLSGAQEVGVDGRGFRPDD